MRLTEKQENKLWWWSRVLILVAGALAFVPGFVSALSAADVVGNAVSQVTGGVVALLVGVAGYAARWCEQHLDPSRGPLAPPSDAEKPE